VFQGQLSDADVAEDTLELIEDRIKKHCLSCSLPVCAHLPYKFLEYMWYIYSLEQLVSFSLEVSCKTRTLAFYFSYLIGNNESACKSCKCIGGQSQNMFW